MTTLPRVLIRMKRTEEKTTLSRTMINKYRDAGDFPEAVPIGEKRIAFVEAEIDDWILERIKRRKGAVHS